MIDLSMFGSILDASLVLGFIDPVSIGLMAGAVAGAGGGMMEMFSGNKEKKRQAAEEKRQRRERKLAGIQDTAQQGQAQRQGALGLLAQAAFDWGSSLR